MFPFWLWVQLIYKTCSSFWRFVYLHKIESHWCSSPKVFNFLVVELPLIRLRQESGQLFFLWLTSISTKSLLISPRMFFDAHFYRRNFTFPSIYPFSCMYWKFVMRKCMDQSPQNFFDPPCSLFNKKSHLILKKSQLKQKWSDICQTTWLSN